MTLIKAFLKAGILTELGGEEDTLTGTPQGGILSPLIANVALSALDEHFAHAWQTTMATRPEREKIRRHGGATYRLIRYADDFVVCLDPMEDDSPGRRRPDLGRILRGFDWPEMGSG